MSVLNYHKLVEGLECDVLNIVVVGANDGKHHDPIYEYLVSCNRKSRLVLIEPQKVLISFLEQNYRWHDDKYIVNGAIGEGDIVTLYAVKKEYWNKLLVPYAVKSNWPIYRAPTGITSSNKQHVLDWARKYLIEGNAEDAVMSFSVNCYNLEQVLTTLNLKGGVDVLQIDVEGLDDQVVFNSNIPKYKPKIIFFESAHLSAQRKKKCSDYLTSYGYDIHRAEENTIAILGSVNVKGHTLC